MKAGKGLVEVKVPPWGREGYGWYLWLLAALVAGGPVWAASPPEPVPKLRPPHGEIPPGVWEQHGTVIILLGVLGLTLVATGIWLLLRRKPAAPVPAEALARKELAAFKGTPESGAVLSRVSQVMRHYIGTIFGLAPVEMTTGEFCEALRGNEQAGPELAGAVSAFLRECDRRKFSPVGAEAPLGAVARAEELVTSSERRKAEMRQAAEASAAQTAGKRGV